MRTIALTALLVLLPLVARAQADDDFSVTHDQLPDVQLTLLFTGDLDGRLAPLTCGPEPGLSLLEDRPATLADVAAAVQRVRVENARAGAPPPIVVDTGDLLGSGALVQAALGSEDGAALVASMAGAVGYDLLTLGQGELDLPVDERATLLEALAGAGVRFGAVNLRCDASEAPACAHLRAGAAAVSIVNRGGVRVALVPVVTRCVTNGLDEDQREGMLLEHEVRAAVDAVRQIRDTATADLVVLVAHVEMGRSAPRAALTLARAVPEAHVVIAGGLADEAQPGLSVEAVVLQGGRPLLVGPPVGPEQVGMLRIRVSSGGFAMAPSPPLRTPRPPMDAAVARGLAALKTRHCAAAGR